MGFSDFDFSSVDWSTFGNEARAIVKLANVAFIRRQQENEAEKAPISKSDVTDLKITLADPNSFFNKAGGRW